MSIQSYRRIYRRIQGLVRKNTPVAEGMCNLLDLCQEISPSPHWRKLYHLRFEDDLINLTIWLERLVTSEPPPKKVTGLWFGLFNPVLDDEKPTSCLYLAGSTRFNPEKDDLNLDWACSPAYWPEGRYSDSTVLTEIYRTVSRKRNGIGAVGEYTLCLGYAALAVSAWCRSPLREKLLGQAPFRGVTVGFDSGDEVLIEVLRNE
jgi:hypothetical protein